MNLKLFNNSHYMSTLDILKQIGTMYCQEIFKEIYLLLCYTKLY